MATLHLSEADAARDWPALLSQLVDVSEIVIERGETNIVIRVEPRVDPAYESWFDAQVQMALDDPDEGVDAKTAQAEFLKFREALLARKADR